MRKIQEKLKTMNYNSIFILLLGILIGGICVGSYRYITYQKTVKKEMNTSREQKNNQKDYLNQKKMETQFEQAEDSSQLPSYETVTPSENIYELPVSQTPSLEERNEADVVSFLNNQERIIESVKETGNISLLDSIQQGFSTIVQFLFHEGTIKGYTFQELTAKTKLQVLRIALTIDSKIDAYFPNYKNKIKSGVLNLKEKIAVKYLEITSKICENHSETCTQARIDFKNLKENFGLTFSILKEVLVESGTALKEWYHILKS